MSVIFSALLLYCYLWVCYYCFHVVLKYMSSITSDFFIQILPGWLIISLFSVIALNIYPEFLHGKSFLSFMFYVACIISIFLFVLLLIKPFNKSIYYKLMKVIKKNRNIDWFLLTISINNWNKRDFQLYHISINISN